MKKSEKIVTKNPLVIWLWILGLILPVLLFLKFYEFYSGAWVPMFIPKPWYVADKIVIYKAWVLSLIWGTITLLFFVKTLKTVWKKSLKNASLTFLLWIITYLSIFVVAPSYTFQNYPRVFMYMDAKGEYIKYPSYYFWLVEKMGFYWQTFKPFKESNQVNDCFKFWDANKLYTLLYACINDSKEISYDNIFSNPQPKTFYILFLLKLIDSLNLSDRQFFDSNILKIDTYIAYIRDKEIKEIYTDFTNDYKSLKNKSLDYNQEMSEFIKKYRTSLEEKLK